MQKYKGNLPYNQAEIEEINELFKQLNIIQSTQVKKGKQPEDDSGAFTREDTINLVCTSLKVRITRKEKNKRVLLEFFAPPFLKAEPDFSHEFTFAEFDELGNYFTEMDFDE